MSMYDKWFETCAGDMRKSVPHERGLTCTCTRLRWTHNAEGSVGGGGGALGSLQVGLAPYAQLRHSVQCRCVCRERTCVRKNDSNTCDTHRVAAAPKHGAGEALRDGYKQRVAAPVVAVRRAVNGVHDRAWTQHKGISGGNTSACSNCGSQRRAP